MPQNTIARRLHAHVFRRHRRTAHRVLLNDDEFRFAADCERMRVDRNGSMLSLLLIRLPNVATGDPGIDFLERILEGRLRVTDTPGQLRDGRVAVLLPDTPQEGAWKVAEDISEVYPPGPGRPECEVLVYPDPHHQQESDPADEEDEIANAPSTVRRQASEEPPGSEFFFARGLPIWKRLLDIFGAIVGLVISLPILVASAAAIKLSSPGPVFFTQEREGHGGRRFLMWKLRTMIVDAEQQKRDLRQHSHQDGPAFKMRSDPRRTAVGRLLRWTSMDELPQFWNVLRGEMSLVGPRPLPTEESRACDSWHRRRLDIVPGMTCTWQVSERGNVRFDEWVRMDLRYAQRVSFIEDLRLLIVTLPSLVMQKGVR